MEPNRDTAVLMLVYLFAVALVGPSNIANAAHLGGLFFGAALGLLDSLTAKR